GAGELRITPIESRDATHYPLSVTVIPDEQLCLRFGYRADVFDRAQVEQIATRLERVLATLAADPTRMTAEVQLLTSAEREQILATGAGATDEPPSASLLRVVEQQAARMPDAVAIVCSDRCVTHETLHRRAARLAHLLKHRGVRREDLVGVWIKRSIDL